MKAEVAKLHLRIEYLNDTLERAYPGPFCRRSQSRGRARFCLVFTQTRDVTISRLRFFRLLESTPLEAEDIAAIIDPHRSIFTNMDDGHSWSIDDLWIELQQATEPFADIAKGNPPASRTACCPYPSNVRVATPDGPKVLGEVFLTVALLLEVEQITLAQAPPGSGS